MNLGNFWRHTPIKMAILFAILVLFALIIVGTAAYYSIRHEMGELLDARIAEQYRALELTYQNEGREDLVEIVNTRALAGRGDYSVYTLYDGQGNFLAGNTTVPSMAPGVYTISTNSNDDDSVRLFVGKLDNLRLIVGVGLEDIEEANEVVLVSFIWAAIAIVGLCIAGGIFLTRKLQRRFDVLGIALNNVADGDWDARLPVSRSEDDIDEFLQNINRTFDRLQDLMEAMHQISTDIAHDLRTPMSRLLISAEEGLKPSGTPAHEKAALAKVRDEAKSITETFDALLGIAQVRSGAAKERFEQVSLSSLLENIVEIYKPVLEQHGFQLHYEDSGLKSSFVDGDQYLLTQMVANLLENAVHHSETGTSVSLLLTTNDQGAPLLVVSDNGVGIPKSERDKVFRRLYRLEKSRTSPGSGLGLNLVRAIADLHSAIIELKENKQQNNKQQNNKQQHNKQQHNNPGLKIQIQFPKRLEHVKQH